MAEHALGQHILVEFYDCSPELLDDVVHTERSMVHAAEEANATIINTSFHHFSPYGVSGVVVIQESHLSIHTWPEYGFASVDIFSCGDTVDPWTAYKSLKESLKAESGSTMELHRGQQNLLTKRHKLPVMGEEDPDHNLQYSPHYARNIWFTEKGHNFALSLRHTGDVLYRKKSPYQRVEVYDTFAYGRMLAIDGLVMCTEQDEYVYHEMVAHVPMLTHPNPKRVLVVGGGDGGTVRELLRHECVEEVVMVEIDGLVVEACREFLPTLASQFDHPKLDLRIEDGVKYVKNSPDKSFDVVIVDSSDPVGPNEGLFTEAFYRNVHRILTDDGIMVTQSESPRMNVRTFQELYHLYKSIFGQDQVHCYLAFIPTYTSGMWSFSYSSKGSAHPLAYREPENVTAFVETHQLKYYNEGVHKGAFALPNFVTELLKQKELAENL